MYTHIHTYIHRDVYVWLVRKCIMAVPWRGPRVLINLSSANFKKNLLRIYSLIMFGWSMSPFALSARREKDIVALNKHSPCSPQVQEGRCWMSGTKLCQGLAGNKVSRTVKRSEWTPLILRVCQSNHMKHTSMFKAICCNMLLLCVYVYVYMYYIINYICLYRPQWLACRVSQLPSVEWGKGVRRMVMAIQNLDGNGPRNGQSMPVILITFRTWNHPDLCWWLHHWSPLVTAVLSSWSLSCHMFEVQEMWSLHMPCHFCCHFSINQVRQINQHCNI